MRQVLKKTFPRTSSSFASVNYQRGWETSIGWRLLGIMIKRQLISFQPLVSILSVCPSLHFTQRYLNHVALGSNLLQTWTEQDPSKNNGLRFGGIISQPPLKKNWVLTTRLLLKPVERPEDEWLTIFSEYDWRWQEMLCLTEKAVKQIYQLMNNHTDCMWSILTCVVVIQEALLLSQCAVNKSVFSAKQVLSSLSFHVLHNFPSKLVAVSNTTVYILSNYIYFPQLTT